jgi:hypothetical protein
MCLSFKFDKSNLNKIQYIILANIQPKEGNKAILEHNIYSSVRPVPPLCKGQLDTQCRLAIPFKLKPTQECVSWMLGSVSVCFFHERKPRVSGNTLRWEHPSPEWPSWPMINLSFDMGQKCDCQSWKHSWEPMLEETQLPHWSFLWKQKVRSNVLPHKVLKWDKRGWLILKNIKWQLWHMTQCEITINLLLTQQH